MHSSKLLAMSCAAALSAYGAIAQAADVVIGVPNWPSVRATAHVLKVALESKLGIEVELQEGENRTVFEAMDAGTIHVHPELWLPNMSNFKGLYVDAKQTIRMNPNAVSGEQAMCVTKASADRTGIVALKDLTDADMASQFDNDGDGKGDIWIGASGWASTTVEKIRARSYGYDDTMTLLEMDESDALARLDSAVENDRNIVLFCYTPHHMFAQHELVRLEEPAYDAKRWLIVQPSATPGWLERSTAGVAWDAASIHVAYAASLEVDQPDAASMLANVALDAETLTGMTHALVVEQKGPAEFAAQWVEENADTVDGWLP